MRPPDIVTPFEWWSIDEEVLEKVPDIGTPEPC
jgi:hypothetical protein